MYSLKSNCSMPVTRLHFSNELASAASYLSAATRCHDALVDGPACLRPFAHLHWDLHGVTSTIPRAGGMASMWWALTCDSTAVTPTLRRIWLDIEILKPLPPPHGPAFLDVSITHHRATTYVAGAQPLRNEITWKAVSTMVTSTRATPSSRHL